MCVVINMWCWHLLLVTVVILILINVCCYQHVVLHLLLVTVVILILINVCCYQHVVLAPTTSNSGYFDIDKCVLLSTCGVGTYY